MRIYSCRNGQQVRSRQNFPGASADENRCKMPSAIGNLYICSSELLKFKTMTENNSSNQVTRPTISILIPVYNYDCSALVKALLTQCDSLRVHHNASCEIIVGDDASDKGHGIEHVKDVCEAGHCRFFAEEKHAGRARHRNNMAREATGEYLLFIDCDAIVSHDDFLEKYYQWAKHGEDVVVGGIAAVTSLPSPDYSLRFRYEQEATSIRSVRYRKAHEYLHLSTFNFMIKRDIFTRIRFDERCRNYGFEDTLFGLQLKQEGIHITHIDNTLIHNGLDTNDVFLNKTEESLRTLHSLGADIQRFTHVGASADKLKKWNMDASCRAFYKLFRRAMRSNLCGDNPSMTLFKLYKLGYYCSLNA